MPTLDKVSLDIQVVLGTTSMPVHQVLRLGRGAIIELDTSEDDEVAILANNFPVARGHGGGQRQPHRGRGQGAVRRGLTICADPGPARQVAWRSQGGPRLPPAALVRPGSICYIERAAAPDASGLTPLRSWRNW